MPQDSRLNTNKVVMNLCFRIERMCRYSPLDDKEINELAMKDRRIVEGFYAFYKKEADSPEIAARKARANAIRLILNEVLS